MARANFHTHAKRARVYKCIYGNTAFTLVMMYFIINNNNNMPWSFAYTCEMGSWTCVCKLIYARCAFHYIEQATGNPACTLVYNVFLIIIIMCHAHLHTHVKWAREHVYAN